MIAVPKRKKRDYLGTLIVVLLAGLLLQILSQAGLLSRYWISVLNLVFINITLAASLNITVGNLGQITLGHAGFMSVGAYTAALFVKAGLLPHIPAYALSLLIGGLCAGVCGLLIGIPVLRLKGDYLAIVTLAFGEIIRVIVENLKATGGAAGLAGIPTMKNMTAIYFIMAACVAMMYSVMTGRHGRAVLAISDNEIAADSSGVNTTWYKIYDFTLSAFFAGVAGAMYAQNMGVISADIFSFNKSVDILVMVVLGGMGSFTGAILSATVLTILPELLRAFSDWRMVIYSVILILVMIFRPQGLMGRSEISIARILDKMGIGVDKEPLEAGEGGSHGQP